MEARVRESVSVLEPPGDLVRLDHTPFAGEWNEHFGDDEAAGKAVYGWHLQNRKVLFLLRIVGRSQHHYSTKCRQHSEQIRRERHALRLAILDLHAVDAYSSQPTHLL